MERILIFAYGVVAYVIFLGVFLYTVGFVGNFGTPTRLDGPAVGPFWTSVATNMILLSVFALQHSVMARPGFKRWWTQFVPVPAERSTYVLFSSVALILLFAYWQPLGGTVWNVTNRFGQVILFGLFGLGWVIVLWSTFQINHFDLFGLRQVWLHLRDKPYTPLKFSTPLLYRYVRHPLYVGWLFVFWATPTMTSAHLLFAVVTAAYIFIAIPIEERDLVAVHGDDYENYRERVPKIIPRIGW